MVPVAVACAGAWLWPVAAAAADAPRAPDSTRWRFEIGAGADVSNERYFEDTSIVVIGAARPVRVDAPERRAAAVAAATVEGLRGGALSYRLRQDLALGDRITRAALDGQVRHAPNEAWRVSLSPRAEYRHDRTFDRDLEELRAAGTLRVRRGFALAGIVTEAAGRGEWLATSGAGSEFLPDRRSAGGSVAIESSGLLHDARLSAGGVWRTHPDSMVRDHHELQLDGHARVWAGAGHAWSIDGTLVRRVPRAPPPDTRDDYREARAGLEWDGWAWSPLSLRARTEAEWLAYDRPDTAVWLDQRTWRARMALQLARETWSVAVGPRAEWLRAPDAGQEDYDELAGALDVEFTGAGAWWSVSPAAGRRTYRFDGGPAAGGLASPHTFVEISLLADQPVPGHVRLRLTGAARFERHDERANDATSLYFSIDLRKIL